jgi:hypothetical protein
MGWRIEVLLACLPAPKGSIVSITLEDMSGQVQMLLECLLAPEDSVASIAPWHVVDIVLAMQWWFESVH